MPHYLPLSRRAFLKTLPAATALTAAAPELLVQASPTPLASTTSLPTSFDDIPDYTPFLELVGRYTTYYRSGFTSQIGWCGCQSRQEEKSLLIDCATERVRCPKCGLRGDIVDFVERYYPNDLNDQNTRWEMLHSSPHRPSPYAPNRCWQHLS